jgi:hypothetical protein
VSERRLNLLLENSYEKEENHLKTIINKKSYEASEKRERSCMLSSVGLGEKWMNHLGALTLDDSIFVK